MSCFPEGGEADTIDHMWYAPYDKHRPWRIDSEIQDEAVFPEADEGHVNPS